LRLIAANLCQEENLVSGLRKRVEANSSRSILRFLGDQEDDQLTLTYEQIDLQARSIGAQLQQLGAMGERTLVLHQPGVGYVTALLGCLYAGSIAVPAYPPRFNRSMTRLRDVVVDAQAKFALTSRNAHERMSRHIQAEPSLAALTWLSTDVSDVDHSDQWRHVYAQEDDVAILQYTSGSTSAPKGVMLTHGNLLYNIAALVRTRDIQLDDHFVTWLPPYHDMGLIGATLLPLCENITATLLTPSAFLQRPARWLSAISRYRGTISGGPNFAYELCVRRVTAAQRETLDLSSWRVAFSGAERVRGETLQRFADTFASTGFRRAAFAPCYGLAEATLGVSFTPAAAEPSVIEVDTQALGHNVVAQPGMQSTTQPTTLVGCGEPLKDCEVLIVNPETCERQAADAIGEIWVRSPGVAQGYWAKPELTQQIFNAQLKNGACGRSYLRTGDLGFLRNNQLYVTGRIKDLIVLRGVNYYPEDIETTVEASHPSLRLAAGAAFAVDQDGEERLIVVNEVEHGRDLPLQQIAAAIQHVIAETHELRAHAVVLVPAGSVPRTSSGKIQRGRCREMYLHGEFEPLLSIGSTVVAAGDAPKELIDRVGSVMGQVLGLDSITADDDFFWLGGHSLLATQLVSRLRERFNVDLPLRAVFESATPRLLAARVANAPLAEKLPPIEAVDRNAPLPLSFSQERMWFMHQLNPHGTAYNVAGAVRLTGAIDLDALRSAFAAVLARHEVLRSNYLEVDGVPQLRIADHVELPLPVQDLSMHDDADSRAQRCATALTRKPFDIARDLLIRAELYQTGREHYLLCVSLHHLITDAWSMGLLISDVKRFYELQLAGEPLPAPATTLTYVDYANWQRTYFTDALLQRELDYWRTQLKGAEALELPTDRPRALRNSVNGELEPLNLSDELLASLEALSTAQGTTLFMTMLAAFEVLLHRYTSSSDLVVGVPVANRNWLSSEALMGTLVNTVPMRLQINGDPSFAELLTQVRQVALDAYAHQNLPFEKLISELGVERRAGESPLVRVMFDYQNTPMPNGQIGNVHMTPVNLSRGSAQFDLSLLILNTDIGRVAGVEYSTDLFDASTIQRFLSHYHSILEAVALQPHEAISRIPLLTTQEKSALLTVAQATLHRPNLPKSVFSSFAAQAQLTPQAAAVSDDQGSYSYAELQERVQHFAAALHDANVSNDARVALYLERDRDLVAAMLAVLGIGAAYIPLDPRHPQDRIAYVLEDAAPQAVLTSQSLKSLLPAALQAKALCIDALPTLELKRDALGEARNEQQAAYVIYTSGSTGRPKGVEVSRHALANFVHSIRHTPGLRAHDRLLSVTTVAFDIAGLEIFVPLCAGACVYMASSDVVADGQLLLQLMRRWQPTVLQATPATFKMLIEAGWQGDEHLKILCGGEAMPRELADALLPRCASLWNMYGPTETTIWSTLHQVRAERSPLVPIGVPLDATAIYILDAHQQLVPIGVPGEIYIGGEGVANGYFKRPELTAEKFLADSFNTTSNTTSNKVPARMYRTGDAGRWRSDGVLEHLGRLDTQIKIRGFRIEPGEIEVVIKDNTAVRDAVVIAREDVPGDVRLVAYYVPTNAAAVETGLPLTELLEPLRRKLPAYMIPGTFLALAELPLTPNGKIDRKALPKPVVDTTAVSEDYLGPRNEIETALTQLWQQLLNVNRIGVRDNFFMLGGHSLLAVRCFARIKQQFDVTLPMSSLFERPTIEYLAELIRNAMPRPEMSTARIAMLNYKPQRFEYLVPIRPQGFNTPVYCVHGAGGNVLNFWPIVHHMGPDRPVYGLQASGVDGVAKPHTDINSMASAYLAEIRKLQPHGPYYLSGYCGGGWVAFEMARQLRAAGETVATLILLDCYGPTVEMPTPTWSERWQHFKADGFAYLKRAFSARVHRDWHSLTTMSAIVWHRLRKLPVPYELRDFWLTRCFMRATRRYRPGIYDGELLLLRARDIDAQLRETCPLMGWENLATGGIEVIDVPGNHHTLAQEPNAACVAAVLRTCLVNAKRQQRPRHS